MTNVCVGFRPPFWCPYGWHQHGVSIQISINLEKKFLCISRIRKIAVTRILARVFAYLPSFISQLLDFIYWLVVVFILIYRYFLIAWHWKPAITCTWGSICNTRILMAFKIMWFSVHISFTPAFNLKLFSTVWVKNVFDLTIKILCYSLLQNIQWLKEF